jgi:hypothetical protein
VLSAGRDDIGLLEWVELDLVHRRHPVDEARKLDEVLDQEVRDADSPNASFVT